ncbi:hypothetical protein [Actinomadura macrotermitis]|nr:hypothetical protein [Actinomadura macrotermitis]
MTESIMTAVISACLLTACSGSDTPPAQGRTRPSASGSPQTGAMEEGWKRNRACAASKAFTGQAATYRRSGPNLFTQEWFNGGYTAVPTPEFPRDDDALLAKVFLPDGWEPGPREGYQVTAAALVLCHTATPSGKRRVATCEFRDIGGPGSHTSTVPVVPATHHFEVYASKSGRLVTSFDLSGTDRDQAAPCPDSAHWVSRLDVIAQPPSRRALVDRLQPLRDGVTP